MGESLTKQKPQFRLKHSHSPAVSAQNEVIDTQERVAVLLREKAGLGRAVNMSKKRLKQPLQCSLKRVVSPTWCQFAFLPGSSFAHFRLL